PGPARPEAAGRTGRDGLRPLRRPPRAGPPARPAGLDEARAGAARPPAARGRAVPAGRALPPPPGGHAGLGHAPRPLTGSAARPRAPGTPRLPAAEGPMAHPLQMSALDTALLVIDVQEKLLPLVPRGPALVRDVGFLIDVALALGMPVYATEQYPRGL